MIDSDNDYVHYTGAKCVGAELADESAPYGSDLRVKFNHPDKGSFVIYLPWPLYVELDVLMDVACSTPPPWERGL